MIRFHFLLFFSLLLSLTLASSAISEDYVAVDSEFRWVEIEDIGRSVEQLRDNSFHGPFPIGFRFPYYGQIYEEYWICANGLIGFGPTNGYNNQHHSELPFHFQPNNLIALYWKDLDPEAFWADNPTIYRGMRNGNLVIQYQNYPEKNDDGLADENSINMQVILRPNGDILLQYRDVGDEFDVTVGAVGIENIDGSEGLTARLDGEGIEISDETAYRITASPPGNYLVWNGGESPSGEAQTSALESLGHTVTFLNLIDNEQLPNDLADYDGLFVNLGNIGEGGDHYHALTAAEGQRLANYLENGGAVYMEGSNSWTVDQATDAHPFFMIEGVGAGAELEPPITGVEGSFTEGMIFDGYEAEHNNSVDHLAAMENAQELFTYMDMNGEFIGMIGFLGQEYRTIGSSFEFGGLVDGEAGSKAELMRRILRFFRTPPPEFPVPVNLRAMPGNQEVTLTWDYPPHEGRDLQEIVELQHEISQLTEANRNEKPNRRERETVVQLKQELAELHEQLYANPRRDELTGFNIYIDGELYDFTNAHRYSAIELANGDEYEFAISSVHVDPDGESELTAPVTAIPTGIITPPYTLDFEQTRGPFVPVPADDGWEWGEPAVGAASGERAWGTRLDEPYEDLMTYVLYSPVIDLRELRIAWLNFNHYMECEGGWDGGRIEISLNGDRWSPLTPRGGYNEETVFAFNDHPAFSGSTNGWESVSFDLQDYLNRLVQLRFVFKSDDSNFRPYAGWFIDDLWLSGPDLGELLVTVVEEDNETPVQNATVSLGDEYERVTDEFGLVRLHDIPEGVWNFTISKMGYISIEDEVNIVGDELTEERVLLEQWDSNLNLEPEDFDIQLNAGQQSQDVLILTNGGDQATSFHAYIAYDFQNDNQRIGRGDRNEGPRRDEPWDLVQTYDLSEETGEQFFIGVQFVQHQNPMNYRLIAGAGDFNSDTCFFYQFNREGEYLGRVEQDDWDIVGWGLRDLAYDGQFAYGAVDDRLFEINPITGDVNNEIINIEHLDIHRAVAFDPQDNAFWVGDSDERWFKIHRGTLRVLDIVVDHGLTGVTGMAWNPSDPDGAHLYIHNQETENGGAAIYRFNPETRELFRQLETAAEDEGSAGGLFVTYLYDTHNYHVGALIQRHDGDDVVKLYELYPHDSWLTVAPTSGDIEENGEVELTVSFNASNLTQSLHQATIEIHDLNTGDVVTTLCRLEVIGGLGTITASVVFDDDADIFDLVFLDVYDEFGTLVDFANPDDEGDAAFFNLNPGNYWMQSVNLEGYEDWFSDRIELDPDEQVHLDITLEHIRLGGAEDFPALTGTVTSFEDEELVLEGVEVAAVLEEEPVEGVQRYYTAVTDSAGVYTFIERIPEGDYTVTAFLRGWRTDPQAGVEIREGEEVEVNFVMNDRLAVQSVRSSGYSDDTIELTWLPPGTIAEEITLQYDSNILANGVYMPNRNDVLAVRFEPEGEYDILAFSIYIFGDGDLGRNDWPDWREDAFYVNLFDEDPETGLPGEMLLEEFVDDDHNQRWETIEPDDEDARFLEGPVYFGWHQDPLARFNRYEALGLDDSFDHEGTLFVRFDNIWEEYNALPGDPMMRLLIWSYFEDRPIELDNFGETDGTRRTAHETDNRISLLNPGVPGVSLYVDPFADIFGKRAAPRRDPVLGYRVFVDGELVVDDLDEPEWAHEIGSENEDRQYEYMISSIYEADDEPLFIDGAETTGRANIPPRRVRSGEVEPDGLEYTVSWISPVWNEDLSACIDYAGCEIFLDDELVHFTPVNEDPNMDEYSWSSELEAGQDGWHTIRLVARDEVPNRSTPVEITTAIGQAVIHNFEQNDQPIYEADPVINGWVLSEELDGGPRFAHSGRFAWGITPDDELYPANMDVSLFSHRYSVTGEAVSLDFYHFLSCEQGNDGGQLLISVDNGDWEIIEPVGGYDEDRIDALINTAGFSGETGGWELVSFDLDDYRDHTVRFKFRFASDHLINSYAGWYVDDVVLWGCELTEPGEVTGTVHDNSGDALMGATVTDGRVSTMSGDNGAFRLTDLIPGQVTLTASKTACRPQSFNIDIANGDSLGQDFELYRPELVVEPQSIEWELRAGEQVDMEIEITNEGEETVPWSIRIVEFDEPERDNPWEILFDYPLSEITGHSRFQGVEFVLDEFFLTAADPLRGPVIDKLDRNGDHLGTFGLLLESVGWGLRDLTHDGVNNLYSSQNDSIYGFTVNVRPTDVQAGAPLDLNRALAYDPENDGFWAAEWDSPWYLVDRDGGVQLSWDDHGLSGVYGFAYHPDEPDDMPLYVLNREDDGSTGIYRADPGEGNIELVHEADGSPTGCFISGDWDPSLWVLGCIIDDHLVGFELGPGPGWVTVVPTSGQLEAEESVEVALMVNIPEDAEGMFEAVININSYGGEQVAIDLIVDVLDGFRHFNAPVEGDQFMKVRLEEVSIFGDPPAWGSEVAVFTPEGEIGGVGRWFGRGCSFNLYMSDEQFEPGDPASFVIWDADDGQEYIPLVEFDDECRGFREGATWITRLSVVETVTQNIHLDPGWNLISSSVQPLSPFMDHIWTSELEPGNLVLLKNGSGKFWAPTYGYRGLSGWDPLKGYLVNVINSTDISLSGRQQQSAETVIPLNAGYNMVAYIPDRPLVPEVAISGVMDDLYLLKDGQGHFVMPEWDYFGISQMEPGQGYKFVMHRPANLIYQTVPEGVASRRNPLYGGDTSPTGSDMSLLILGIENLSPVTGSNLIVLAGDDDRPVVDITFQASNRAHFPCGVIVRGDDSMTQVIEGAHDKDLLTFAVRSSDGELIELECEVKEGEITFEDDGFAVIELTHPKLLPQEYSVEEIYPNPFNGRTAIRFGLPEAAEVGIAVWSIQGRQVAKIPTQRYEIGWHSVEIDASDWSSGVYFVEVNMLNSSTVRKMVLAR